MSRSDPEGQWREDRQYRDEERIFWKFCEVASAVVLFLKPSHKESLSLLPFLDLPRPSWLPLTLSLRSLLSLVYICLPIMDSMPVPLSLTTHDTTCSTTLQGLHEMLAVVHVSAQGSAEPWICVCQVPPGGQQVSPREESRDRTEHPNIIKLK